MIILPKVATLEMLFFSLDIAKNYKPLKAAYHFTQNLPKLATLYVGLMLIRPPNRIFSSGLTISSGGGVEIELYLFFLSKNL